MQNLASNPMTHEGVSFPLCLCTDSISQQIETIGLAFTRYNTFVRQRMRKSHRCCAIALMRNRIVSIGVNKSKTAPAYKEYVDNHKYMIHAEIDMIMQLNPSAIDKVTDIWVVRGMHHLLPSFPCKLCFSHIKSTFKPKCILHFYNGGWINSCLGDLTSWEDG